MLVMVVCGEAVKLYLVRWTYLCQRSENIIKREEEGRFSRVSSHSGLRRVDNTKYKKYIIEKI